MSSGKVKSDIQTGIKKGYKKVRRPLILVLLKTLFSRGFITIVLICLQVYIIMAMLYRVDDYSKYIIQGFNIMAAITIIVIINSKSDGIYKMSWSLIVAALPIAGLVLYVFTHLSPADKIPFGRMRKNIERTSEYAKTTVPVRDRIMEQDEDFVKLAGYIEHTGHYASYDNTEVKYYPIGDDVLEDMCRELEKAESFIFVEYFIIAGGMFWDSILDILERKADEGVEVRVMYDDLGCMQTLPRKYYKKLRKKGIMSHVFSRIRPFLSTYYNNRDHRKVMVIDGKVAFSGGINLADEYINEYKRFGTWKDNAFMLKGDAVRNYTYMFLQMWDTSNKMIVSSSYDRYLNVDTERKPDTENDGFITPYADGPYQQDGVAENVYIDIINSANRNVDIMTPYLIPDNGVLHALKHAAKSGVDVNMILPFIPDKKLTNLVTKSYYKELIKAGVHIHEYKPGFVHTKLVAADDEICSTGTVNLDCRSLYLHYECGCLMYKNAAVADIAEDFNRTLEDCKEISLAEIKSWTFIFTVVTSVLRVFAPLL